MFLEVSGSVGSETFDQRRVAPSQLISLLEKSGIEIPAAIKRASDYGYQFNYVRLGEKDRHGQQRLPQGVKVSAQCSVSAPGVAITVIFFRNKTNTQAAGTQYTPHKLSYQGANPWFRPEDHAEALFLYLSGLTEKTWAKTENAYFSLFDAEADVARKREWAITQAAFVKSVYEMDEQELKIRAGGIEVGGRRIDLGRELHLIQQDIVQLVMTSNAGYNPADVVSQFNHTEANWLGVIRNAAAGGVFTQSATGYWQWAKGELTGTNIIAIPPGQQAFNALVTWATNPLNKDILLSQLQALGYVMPNVHLSEKKVEKAKDEVYLGELVKTGAIYFHKRTKEIRTEDDKVLFVAKSEEKWLSETLKDLRANPDKYNYVSIGDVHK